MAARTVLSHRKLHSYWKRIKTRERYQKLIPEILFQRLYEGLRERLFPFFHVLSVTQSNLVHRVLAKVADDFQCPLFTTNFDTFIDDLCSNPKSVIHLHGELRDPKTLITRINQVGHGLDETLRRGMLSSLYGKSLYVMGYSGNDKDIIDVINRSRVKSVFWVMRNARDSWTLQNIRSVRANSATVVEMDLSRLASMLGSAFSLRRYHAHRQSVGSSTLRNWNRTIGLADRFAFLQKLCLEIEEFDWSVEACEKGVHHTDGIHTKEWFYSEAANCLRLQGRFREALRQINLAIKHYSPQSDLATLAAAYNVRGLILLDDQRSKPLKALNSFRHAVDLLLKYEMTRDAAQWKNELLVFHARIENNIGLAFHALHKKQSAVQHFQQSLLNKRKAGDLIGRAQTCVNLARLFYESKTDAQRYRYWKSAAMTLIKKYGLRYQEAELLRETGRTDCERLQTGKGLAKLQKALKIYQGIDAAQNDLEMTRKLIRQCSAGKVH